ncbi:vWA domain-containing protein [Thermodesulfobacteriota bacterium]
METKERSDSLATMLINKIKGESLPDYTIISLKESPPLYDLAKKYKEKYPKLPVRPIILISKITDPAGQHNRTFPKLWIEAEMVAKLLPDLVLKRLLNDRVTIEYNDGTGSYYDPLNAIISIKGAQDFIHEIGHHIWNSWLIRDDEPEKRIAVNNSSVDDLKSRKKLPGRLIPDAHKDYAVLVGAYSGQFIEDPSKTGLSNRKNDLEEHFARNFDYRMRGRVLDVAYLKKTILILLFSVLLLDYDTVLAIPPDFNADRRVNIRCPVTVAHDNDDQFEPDGLMKTLKRLYHELDENLKFSERTAVNSKYGNGYVFSDDPNHGMFFISHAKASFPEGSLDSLLPQDKIIFQEVFYITLIDWDKLQIGIVRQKDKKRFTINVPDFEKAFIWYNALLDRQRAYIPVYGFLSLPGEADEFPTIWDSWGGHKSDTATPPESLVDYDFYKVLDYQNGFYLLAKDYFEFDYRNNIEDFGIIGWVKKEFITLWRSRLYYHPMRPVQFFDDNNSRSKSKETGEINKFYVEHAYLKERLFSDIVEKLDQENLHKFYTHFGFPQLKDPEYNKDSNYSEVFIPGAFTPRLMRLLSKSIKRNLNTFFLIDISESMRPFADYIKSFNKSVRDMRQADIALRMNRVYAYWDSSKSDRDIKAEPNFIRVKRPEDLTFIQRSKDHNYAEPLMRSFTKILDQIDSLQNKKMILPLHEKLLFIITDAGANDITDESFKYIVKKARDLNIRVYFIYPNDPGVRAPNSNMDDTPTAAYNGFTGLVSSYEAENPEGEDITFRKFEFKAEKLLSEKERQQDFTEQHKHLLDAITAYMDHIFRGTSVESPSKDIILYFSDERLLTEMRKWSDRRIQVLNHVIKYIKSVEDPSIWEERIAIPAKPVESFLRAIRTQDDISIADLKKLIIINSLVSVDDIEKCRSLYDHIKPLIEKQTFKSTDDVFYMALTRREPGKNTRWNKALGEDKSLLGEYLSEREFHLNSFNQAVQRKFMYIKVNELYASPE